MSLRRTVGKVLCNMLVAKRLQERAVQAHTSRDLRKIQLPVVLAVSPQILFTWCRDFLLEKLHILYLHPLNTCGR